MNSYVIHVNSKCRVFNVAEGFSIAEPGWYVMFTNEQQALLDFAGPFDDEGEAVSAQQRAELIAS